MPSMKCIISISPWSTNFFRNLEHKITYLCTDNRFYVMYSHKRPGWPLWPHPLRRTAIARQENCLRTRRDAVEQHRLEAWVPRSFTILCHYYRRLVSRLLRKPLVSPLSRVLFSFLCQALQLYRFQILFQIMVCFATQKNGNNKCPTIISMTWDWGRHLLISSLSPAIYLLIGSCFSLSNRWRQWSDLWCLNVW